MPDNSPSLSTFLIVKNEALTVERALYSVLQVSDEYVIGIDGESGDGTAEIVEKFAASHPKKKFIIYRFMWLDDFSEARNEAIGKCSGDWILQLDGHEYLHRGSIKMLKHYLNNLPEEIWLVAVRMHLEPLWSLGAADGEEIPEIWFIQPHLWRNGKGIRYEGKSHNQITHNTCPVEKRLRTPDIVIVHDRPHSNALERKGQRERMNTPYFEQMVHEDPHSERGLFYSAMSHVDSAVNRDERGNADYEEKKLQKAIRHARRYLKHHSYSRPEEAFEMASKLGEILAVLERWDEARDAFFECVKLQPQRAEGYFNLGQVAMRRMELLREEYTEDGKIPQGAKRAEYDTRLFKLYTEADKWLSIAAETPPPVTSYYLRAPIYSFMPMLKLAELNENLYYYTGRERYFLAARRQYREVRKRLPHNIELMQSERRLQEKLKEIKGGKFSKKDKKAIAVFNATGQFTEHLLERWRESCLVNEWRQPNIDGILWGDVVYCSWADTAAIAASEMQWDADLFVRLCRYEAFTDMPRKINWDNVKGLIIPNENLKRYVLDSFLISCPVHVIPFGLDLKKYTVRERGPGENVACICFIHGRKNLWELAEIIESQPDKRFHIAGKVQQRDLWRAFWWRLKRSKADKRVFFYGWQDDINRWLEHIDANYLISTSWNESFGYSIAEAMAKGIKPVIRRFEGADELWPGELIYDRLKEANEMLNSGNYDSRAYRSWVEERYDAGVEAKRYLNLFFGENNEG